MVGAKADAVSNQMRSFLMTISYNDLKFNEQGLPNSRPQPPYHVHVKFLPIQNYGFVIYIRRKNIASSDQKILNSTQGGHRGNSSFQ